ncbi:MAG TPA: hypothetical protein DHU96_33160 [Actinobacteria bacterium]|nr:hypothetical protein [Actinomycetota bacterium]
MARVVRYLAAERGIRQFLDIGTGLPAPGSTDAVAQAIVPDARIVFVDNDPLVLIHARALLTGSKDGRCDYLDADVRDTAAILSAASQTLDFGQPIAVLMLALLHFIPDTGNPAVITATCATVHSRPHHPADVPGRFKTPAGRFDSPKTSPPRPSARLRRPPTWSFTRHRKGGSTDSDLAVNRL